MFHHLVDGIRLTAGSLRVEIQATLTAIANPESSDAGPFSAWLVPASGLRAHNMKTSLFDSITRAESGRGSPVTSLFFDCPGNGTLNAVNRLLCTGRLISAAVHAQNVQNAPELLQAARSFGESTRIWRAQVIVTSQMSGRGLNLQNDEIRTTIAARPPRQVRRQTSGNDRTILVCDGVETLYSGDGHSYYKGDARVTPQCEFPLIKVL